MAGVCHLLALAGGLWAVLPGDANLEGEDSGIAGCFDLPDLPGVRATIYRHGVWALLPGVERILLLADIQSDSDLHA
ncbi:MAG: hypothetical protein CVU41_09850 [Chloroflexi bacterium HGW-Chloroflexi-3]|nr:MAG: hypothetical protein CVU41_09850 [Chloroflexi bacterium HGW-Chloroflexi-3]